MRLTTTRFTQRNNALRSLKKAIASGEATAGEYAVIGEKDDGFRIVATAREAAQAAPQAAKIAPPAPEAPAPQTRPTAPSVGEREAVEADEVAAMQEALRLAYALDKKASDRRRALALIEFVDKHPRMERTSFLHGKIEGAVRLLAAETPRTRTQLDAIKVPVRNLDPKPARKAPPANGALAPRALTMLKAVVAAHGQIGVKVDYAAVETPSLTWRERAGYIAGLQRRGLVKCYTLAPRKYGLDLTEAGLRAAQHG
jgi:hypothetical protein